MIFLLLFLLLFFYNHGVENFVHHCLKQKKIRKMEIQTRQSENFYYNVFSLLLMLIVGWKKFSHMNFPFVFRPFL